MPYIVQLPVGKRGTPISRSNKRLDPKIRAIARRLNSLSMFTAILELGGTSAHPVDSNANMVMHDLETSQGGYKAAPPAQPPVPSTAPPPHL